MSTVVSLVEKRLEPNARIVAKLEELLEAARAGRLRGIAYAAAYSNMTTTSGWERDVDVGDSPDAPSNGVQVALGYCITALQGRYFTDQWMAPGDPCACPPEGS